MTRRADPDDGRATIAAITDEGEEAFRDGARVPAKIDEHFNAHLSARERAVIAGGSASPTLKRPRRAVRLSRAAAAARG